MAIFHLHAQVIKRSEGRSSVAAAAYRLGVALKILAPACAMISAAKGGVSGSLTLAPDNAPAWASGPGSVVGQCGDHREAQRRSTLPRVRHCPAPRTDPQQCATLARAFVQKEFVDRGMCATIAFHHIGGDNPIST
jgi:hypothetical protein